MTPLREIHTGDARVVLRGRVPDGAVVITDPPWPHQSESIYEGGGWTDGLLAETLEACAAARKVVVVASNLTDPRWLAEVPDRWWFVATLWMRYAVPSYRGTRILAAQCAHVFGDHRATRGRRVTPGEMVAASNTAGRASTIHPTPLRLDHARWIVGATTEVGDVVVDPFAGSGAILRAGVEAGCGALGAELHPAYADEARATLRAPYLLDGAM